MKTLSYFTQERIPSTRSAAVIRKLLLVVFAAVYCLPAFSQWSVLNSGVTNTLRSPFFTNSTTGYVVGEAIAPAEAIILKTTDGGNNWVSKPSGTLNALRGVHFIDDNTGIAVGFTGTILRTTNAGETWSLISSGTTEALRSVHFPSSTVGYIAGGLGTMLKTINGGTTWTAQTTNVAQDLINVRFVNNDIGYAVSSTGTFTNGIVIKTVNGGTTWTPVYTNANGLLGLAVINENIAYAGGGNNQGVGGSSYIVKTTDGGVTWNQVYTGLANGALRGAWFTSANKGWFVGDFGEMPATTNGGATWVNDSIQLNGLLGIHFPNGTVGYAVGAVGTILKYTTVTDCAKPTGLSVLSVTSSTAILQWDAVPGAVGYKIIYHPNGNPAGIKKPSTFNSKEITGLIPNTTYKWSVQTICSNGPVVASTFIIGPDFTTLPQRLSEELNLTTNMQVYPNPAADFATITFTLDNESPVNVRLVDLNGKVLLEIENAVYAEGSHQLSFNSNTLSTGLYLLQLTTSTNVVTKKFIVER
ncbi:MAG: YCF48-related protein [Chitinophagales bacterium]